MSFITTKCHEILLSGFRGVVLTRQTVESFILAKFLSSKRAKDQFEHERAAGRQTQQNWRTRDSDRGDTQEEEGEDAEPDIFEGVTYKRKARYYLAGISPRSTRNGLINYVSRKGIKVTRFILFKAKYPGYI